MKQHLAYRLRVWADRLDPPVVPVERDWSELETTARALMDHQDTIAGRSGEAKRHQVLSALLKHFPAERERDLGWLIERLVRER